MIPPALSFLSRKTTLKTLIPSSGASRLTWDDRNFRTFRADYTVRELETRFCFEEECTRIGKPIKGKAFMAELRERLGRETKNMKFQE